MRQIVRIGLDIARRWFQVRAIDEAEKEVFNRKLPRDKILGFLGSLPHRLGDHDDWRTVPA